eukprot:1078512-Pleurochrysis_carterae.AAC.1
MSVAALNYKVTTRGSTTEQRTRRHSARVPARDVSKQGRAPCISNETGRAAATCSMLAAVNKVPRA